jgi:hypothetical protein
VRLEKWAYARTLDDVAKIVPRIETTLDMNRKSIHVEGGEGSEFEDTFYTTIPESKAYTNAEKELELMSEVSKAHLKEIEWMPTFACQGRNFEVGQVVA